MLEDSDIKQRSFVAKMVAGRSDGRIIIDLWGAFMGRRRQFRSTLKLCTSGEQPPLIRNAHTLEVMGGALWASLRSLSRVFGNIVTDDLLREIEGDFSNARKVATDLAVVPGREDLDNDTQLKMIAAIRRGFESKEKFFSNFRPRGIL